jgi:hypothetical protein
MFGFTLDIGRLPFLIEYFRYVILSTIRNMKKNRCQHPKHTEYLEAFLKKYPSATREGGYGAIIDVDPAEWWASDDESKNTAKCCKMCSISEGIARSSFRNMSTAEAPPI